MRTTRTRTNILVATQLIILAAVLLLATTIHAATREVGSGKPYATIQSAINAAVTGDTVLVYPGVYYENIIVNGKTITVRSNNGRASTIIDGSGSGTVVTFNYGEDSGSVLDGFTIRNGNNYSYSGGGIVCWSSTITNCTITGNFAPYGGGIYTVNTSTTITNCTISENHAEPFSPGLDGGDGGGIYAVNTPPTITNCNISRNTASGRGAGIYADNSSAPLTITNCIISGNWATGGGGGIWGEVYVTITNCTITGNNGGGISVYSGLATVKNSILWGDNATTGKEIYFTGGAQPLTSPTLMFKAGGQEPATLMLTPCL